MYLPSFLLAFGIALILAAIGLTVGFVCTWQIILIALAAVSLVLGVAAIMCWRNQTIRMIDDDHFEYTTFLGNKKQYAFSDIQKLIRNSDSFTLVMTTGKVHIESMAIMSERRQKRIDLELQNLYHG